MSAIAVGRLSLSTTKSAFLADGRFDLNAMLGTLQATVDKATEAGLEGLFVTAEMTWALRPHPGAELLMDYEALCNRFFLTNPAVSLCQYDRLRFDDRAIRDVLLTHPWVLIGGRLIRNFHHISPGEFRVAGADLPLDVGQVLADLVVRDAAERLAAGTTATIEGGTPGGLTTHDARRVAKIYGDLEEFQAEVLARVERRASVMGLTYARSELENSLLQLRGELVGLQARLKFWQERLRRMVGLDYDAARNLIRFNERLVRLSQRESQLIEVLISQNGRPVAADELLRRAWGSSSISPAQLRNYVGQLREKLALMEVSASIVTKRGLGYSLILDPTSDAATTQVLPSVGSPSDGAIREPPMNADRTGHP
jgi:DNA-binding winged helix-turn-helix (wHTH) protein